MSDTNSSEPEHDSESDALPAYTVLPQSQHEVSETSWVDTSHEFTYNLEALKEDLLSKHGLHWDKDLQKAEAKIPANRSNLIPPFYVQVFEAGAGATGDVWLCLPRSFAVAAMHANDNKSPFTYKELEANLVAVKVSQGYYQVGPALNEAKVLQELSKRIETADTETIPRFGLPQAHSTAGFDDKDRTLSPFWLALRAVQPALPLGDIFDLHVTDVGDDIFQIIVLHSFCEIMDSLSFLHEFSILHNDVHGYNVLLEPTDELPAVCLIDFGLSKSVPGGSSKDGFKEPDYLQLRDTFKFGCQHAHNLYVPLKDELPGWSEFIELINDDWGDSFEELLKSALPVARTAIRSITSQKRTEVAQRLREFCEQTDRELSVCFGQLGLFSSSADDVVTEGVEPDSQTP